MIYSLSGTLLEKTTNDLVIECAGVGYFVTIPASCAQELPPVGSMAKIYTHMNISENDVSLYGFADAESRSIFRVLIGVSGVGPKAAVAILNALAPQQIVLAVSAGDYKAFTAAQGVGPKLGQRIVLELKDKVAKDMASGTVPAMAASGAPGSAVGQAIAALVSLGYNQSEAAQAVALADSSLPVAEIIRTALKSMGGGV